MSENNRLEKNSRVLASLKQSVAVSPTPFLLLRLQLPVFETPELEKIDELKRRIDEASKYIPLEQLAISPQCGFSTNVGGNLISEDDQKKKLELVVETARQVWGTVG